MQNRVAEALDSTEYGEGGAVPASHASCGIAGAEAAVLADFYCLRLPPLGLVAVVSSLGLGGSAM